MQHKHCEQCNSRIQPLPSRCSESNSKGKTLIQIKPMSHAKGEINIIKYIENFPTQRKSGVSLITQLVKNLPAKQETLVQFLSREEPLEKGQATHSSILGLPSWLSWSRIHLQCGRPRFDPWVGKIPQKRERLLTPVSWPREFYTVHGVAKSWTGLCDFHFHWDHGFPFTPISQVLSKVFLLLLIHSVTRVLLHF